MSNITISGNVKLIKREKLRPPNDGIHRAGKEGYIKGVHSVMLDDILIPKGSVGFYYPLKNDFGIKVYIGGFPDRPWVSKRGVVETAYLRLFHLSLSKLGPAPGHVLNVNVNWVYKGKKFKKKAFGVTSKRCQYPKKAWEDYARGLPYDFNCLDRNKHPEHCEDGYWRFCEQLRIYCKARNLKFSCYNYKKDKGPKIGDAVYDMASKGWLLVDPD